jgi:hypothetical protein
MDSCELVHSCYRNFIKQQHGKVDKPISIYRVTCLASGLSCI